MGRLGVNAKFFAAAAATIIAVAVALLLMATAAVAQAGEKNAACSDSIKNQDESGVDCGGSCVEKYVLETCDGKDNDKDCIIDEDCKNNTGTLATPRSSPAAKGPGAGQQENVPAGQDSNAGAKVPQDSSASGETQGQMGETGPKALQTEPTDENDESLPTPTGVVEGMIVETDETSGGQAASNGEVVFSNSSVSVGIQAESQPAQVQEEQAVTESVAVTQKISDMPQESFMGKILIFFGLRKAEAEDATVPEITVKEPTVNEKEPLPEVKAVSESPTAMPIKEAGKEDTALPVKSAEKQSFIAKLLSMFK